MKFYNMGRKKVCIIFAWAVGSSKTPISNYLSIKLNLPVFNNDAIRSEVIEDLGFFDSNEHIKRRNLRLEEIIKVWNTFICDVSVDREWTRLKEILVSYDYDFFIISLNLSKDLLIKLYKAKEYFNSLSRIDELIEDHNNFLAQYSGDIKINITDNDFTDRIQISYQAVSKYLEEN